VSWRGMKLGWWWSMLARGRRLKNERAVRVAMALHVVQAY
jgi:hypothetical protein